MAIASALILKLCSALGSAFKSSFDCQMSQLMGDARPTHSAHREGYMGGAKHQGYMDFPKARGIFSCPNKLTVGKCPYIIAQSCSCIGRSRPLASCALLRSVLFSPCEPLVAFWVPVGRHLETCLVVECFFQDIILLLKYASLQYKKTDKPRYY